MLLSSRSTRVLPSQNCRQSYAASMDSTPLPASARTKPADATLVDSKRTNLSRPMQQQALSISRLVVESSSPFGARWPATPPLRTASIMLRQVQLQKLAVSNDPHVRDAIANVTTNKNRLRKRAPKIDPVTLKVPILPVRERRGCPGDRGYAHRVATLLMSRLQSPGKLFVTRRKHVPVLPHRSRIRSRRCATMNDRANTASRMQREVHRIFRGTTETCAIKRHSRIAPPHPYRFRYTWLPCHSDDHDAACHGRLLRFGRHLSRPEDGPVR